MASLQFYLDVLEAILGPAMLVIAWLVYRASPRNWANRSLAVFIFIEGLTFGGIANGIAPFVPQRIGAALMGVVFFSFGLIAPAYLWFTAEALDNRFTRPLRTVTGRILLAAATVATAAYYLVGQPALLEVLGWLVAASLYAMFAALISLRRSTGVARRRAGTFLCAFALRDLAIVGIVVGYAVGTGTTFQQHSSFWWSVVYAFFPFMVAFGVLRGQIVDLDERVRWSIGRGTVVAAALAVYFVATELAEGPLADLLAQAVPIAWARPMLGLVGAGIIAAAGRPLAALGRRAALLLMPAAPEGAAFYAEQVAIAASDGRMGPKERQGLDNLARRLGLSPTQAARIEAQAT